MKKLAIVGAAAALAWAQGVRAEDVQKKQAETQEKVQKAEAEASKDTQEAKAEAQEKTAEAQKEAREKKAEASEELRETEKDAAKHAQGSSAGERMGTGSGAAAMHDEKKHPTFGDKDNFKLEGRIEAVTASSITVRREELPAAKLSVDPNTKIELDGERVSASQLKQGQEVKASFNLKNDKPMAVEIKAEKMAK